MASATYPVHVQGTLDPPLSRWLWLVKWLLAIPHYLVLALLWLAFLVTSVAAFFAILFTGSYPRALFDFNVGVLRWSWRVTYYAYGALGTDRYPPFTLADVPDYPARLVVDRPERLSRGLVLVKWWLLALPHYLIIGFFAGGGIWFAGRHHDGGWSWGGGGGLIAVLVLVSAVILAATGSYPRSLFDLVLGMQRWVLRVAGYAALMTDVYPPFRLDLGGQDPDGVLALPGPHGSGPHGSGPQGPAAQGSVLPGESGDVPPGPGPATSGWTAGRTVSAVIGAVLALIAVGPLVGGGVALWADRTQRDSSGFLTTPATTLSTDTRALASETITLDRWGPERVFTRSVLGDTRLRFTPTAPDRPVFVGIASARDAETYLAGTRYATVTGLDQRRMSSTRHEGGAPATLPAAAGIWVASSTGVGTQDLTWTPRSGDWTVVVMNADASPGVSVDAEAGATAPALTSLAVALLIGAVLTLALGVTLFAVPLARSASAQSRASVQPPPAG